MKTGIIIITWNIDTRIFLLQIEKLQQYCHDDFTIEIVDNSSNKVMAEAIEYHASLRGINYTRTHSKTKDSSGSHSFAANLSYQLFKDKYDIFFYLDHDCIPVKDFSCEEILGEKLMAGILQAKEKTYIWPGCFMFRKEVGPVDFSYNREFRLDTGGNLYQLLEKYGLDQCIAFTESYRQNELYKGNNYNYFSVINGVFWHCVAASNWIGLGDNEIRLSAFINAINDNG